MANDRRVGENGESFFEGRAFTNDARKPGLCGSSFLCQPDQALVDAWLVDTRRTVIIEQNFYFIARTGS